MSGTDERWETEDGLSRNEFFQRAVILGAAAATAGSAGAAVARAAPRLSTQGSPTGTLVVGVDSVGSDLNPTHFFQGWGHVTALMHMFEPLYAYRNGDATQPIVPVLASGPPRRDRSATRKWAVSLRRGVRFHDGTPFNAQAVVFNYGRALNESHPFHDRADVATGVTHLFGVSSVVAVDQYTVVFTTNRPVGDFRTQFANWGASILSPSAVRRAGVANIGQRPSGTGPFRLVEAIRGDRIVLERFAGYWGPRPGVNRIILRAIPDSAAMTAALLAGDIDISWFVSLDDAARFSRESRFTVRGAPSVSTGYIALNAGGSGGVTTFRDSRFRIAALTAINKQKVINTALRGQARIGAGLSAPGNVAGYQPSVRDFHKYNPGRARTLLSQIGDIPDVTLSVNSAGYFSRIAESIQADWQAVGIKTSIRVVEASAYGATMTRGEHDAFIWEMSPPMLTAWAPYNMGMGIGCASPFRFRYGGWCDPQFDRRLIALIGQANPKKARALTLELDRALLRNGVLQANYYPNQISVWRTGRVSGFKAPVTRWTGLRSVRVR